MKKLLNKKGFTLMEMLIVVAIIVILVAISIPTFSNSLESAKKATDAANLRSAKSAYVMQTMNDAADKINTSALDCYYYNFKEGKFVKAASSTEAETKAKGSGSLGECKNHLNAYITLDASGVKWSNGATDCDTTPPATPPTTP